jgi:hypothetical protein
MANIKIGKIGAIVAGVNVAVFAVMCVGLALGLDTTAVGVFFCMFLAIGYVMFAAALAAPSKDEPLTAAGLAGLAFSVIYAILVLIVYYATLTTVRLHGALGEEMLSIISIKHLGSLFFNYDILGYGFMALSTFFIGFTIIPKTKGDRVLRLLLWIHGIFFVPCFLFPMFPVFTPDMAGGNVIGALLLVVWCAYFLPICILGWRHFDLVEKAAA